MGSASVRSAYVAYGVVCMAIMPLTQDIFDSIVSFYLLSFDRHNNSGGETAASPKGSISIHLLMYFCPRKRSFEDRAAGPRTSEFIDCHYERIFNRENLQGLTLESG